MPGGSAGLASPSTQRVFAEPLRAGLRAAGRVEGGKLTIDWRFIEGRSERLQALLAVLMNPLPLSRQTLDRDLLELTRQLGIEILVFEASRPEDDAAIFDATVRDKADGVLMLADSTFFAHRLELGRLCLKHRLPSTIWAGRDYREGGGLAPFQGDFAELARRGAALADKILKGTPAGGIPVEQPTRFYTTINLKTAKAPGLALPPSLLRQATEVIEWNAAQS